MKKQIMSIWMCLVLAAILGNLAYAQSKILLGHSQNNPYVTDLIVAKNYDMGQVIVWNDMDFLHVKYQLDYIWTDFLETHLHVALHVEDIPQVNGNPVPGKFAYHAVHDRWEQEYTYDIPLDPEWKDGTELYIAAHAYVTGTCGECETAWGLGIPFGGLDSWGMYFVYTVDIPSKILVNVLGFEWASRISMFF